MKTKIVVIKHLIAVVSAVAIITEGISQSVSVNVSETTTNSNSLIDVCMFTNSSEVLIPWLTEAQKNDTILGMDDTGLLIYQIDQLSGFWYWNGVGWYNVLSRANVNAEMYVYNHLMKNVIQKTSWWQHIDWIGGKTKYVTPEKIVLTIN